jgi:hypothetical protein
VGDDVGNGRQRVVGHRGACMQLTTVVVGFPVHAVHSLNGGEVSMKGRSKKIPGRVIYIISRQPNLQTLTQHKGNAVHLCAFIWQSLPCSKSQWSSLHSKLACSLDTHGLESMAATKATKSRHRLDRNWCGAIWT